jgi:prepilin-type processing-associated H-X9-DG protein
MGEICIAIGRREIQAEIVQNFSFPADYNASTCAATPDPLRPNYYPSLTTLWAGGHGQRWQDGHNLHSSFNTVLPPNGPSCAAPAAQGAAATGIFSAGSFHQGGCHLLMCDGAVRFITENVESGNKAAPSVCDNNNNAGFESPYGLWGALGTRNGSENKGL